MKTIRKIKTNPRYGLTKFITQPIERNVDSLARRLSDKQMAPLTKLDLDPESTFTHGNTNFSRVAV